MLSFGAWKHANAVTGKSLPKGCARRTTSRSVSLGCVRRAEPYKGRAHSAVRVSPENVQMPCSATAPVRMLGNLNRPSRRRECDSPIAYVLGAEEPSLRRAARRSPALGNAVSTTRTPSAPLANWIGSIGCVHSAVTRSRPYGVVGPSIALWPASTTLNLAVGVSGLPATCVTASTGSRPRTTPPVSQPRTVVVPYVERTHRVARAGTWTTTTQRELSEASSATAATWPSATSRTTPTAYELPSPISSNP